MNILIVEDNPITSKILVLNLTKHGYTAITAEDGQEALDLMKSNPDIQLAIIDLKLPKLSGAELIEAMKGNVLLNEIPVIICSSENNSEVVEKVITMGIKKYVVKPIKAQQLLVDIRQILGHEREVLVPKTRIIRDMEIDRTIYNQMVQSFANLVDDKKTMLLKLVQEEQDALEIDELNVLYESADMLGAERLKKHLEIIKRKGKISSYSYYFLMHELSRLQKELPTVSA